MGRAVESRDELSLCCEGAVVLLCCWAEPASTAVLADALAVSSMDEFDRGAGELDKAVKAAPVVSGMADDALRAVVTACDAVGLEMATAAVV